MCHKLDTELLQGLEKVLETTDLTEMQKPQPMNPELPSWPVYGFLHMLNNFSVNNVLSQTTAVHHAILDDASVMSEDDPPRCVQTAPGGAGVVCCGLGSSGLHLREASLGAGRATVRLGLGVCKRILTSDTSISIGAEEAFFLFSTKVNSQYILSTTSPPLVQFLKRPLGKIGAFLDDDNGTVSFYEVFRSSLTYSFFPSLFSPLIPFLCLKSP